MLETPVRVPRIANANTATDERAQANAGALKARDAAAVGIVREATASAIDVTANSDVVLKANDTPNTAKGGMQLQTLVQQLQMAQLLLRVLKLRKLVQQPQTPQL